MLTKASIFVSTLVVGALAFAIGSVSAQDFPNKPLRLVVPGPPGSVTDSLSRVMGTEMSKLLGQQIVVENRPGVDSIIGYEYVAKRVPADGYTFVAVMVAGLASLPAVVKDLRFDPVKDLPPFIGFAEGRLVLGSPAHVPWRTLDEMVAYAKANPGKLNYGSPNTSVRLLSESVIRQYGLNVVYIPYSSGPAYRTALISTDIHMGFIDDASAINYGDKFKILAVTGARRAAVLPDVPTFAERKHTLIPGVNYSFNLPAGTPKTNIERLHMSASRALLAPEVTSAFSKLRLEVVEEPPELAAKRLVDIGNFLSDIAKKAGIDPS